MNRTSDGFQWQTGMNQQRGLAHQVRSTIDQYMHAKDFPV